MNFIYIVFDKIWENMKNKKSLSRDNKFEEIKYVIFTEYFDFLTLIGRSFVLLESLFTIIVQCNTSFRKKVKIAFMFKFQTLLRS